MTAVNPWRTLSRPVVDFGTGGEQIARAAALQIANHLEDQCALQDQIWEQRDRDWAAAMGRAYFRTTVTRVPRDHIFLGARPSLVESEWDLWPAITVRVGDRMPSVDAEQADQVDSFDLALIVEVLTVAGPFREVHKDRDPSDEIDRQYQRLADAVHCCVALDRSLAGNNATIKRPPRMRPSLPFVRKEDKGTGGKLLFQGMELTYSITKLSY